MKLLSKAIDGIKKKVVEFLVLYVCAYAFVIEVISFYWRRKYIGSSSMDKVLYDDAIEEELTLSVVIAVKNESETIGKTLRNLEATTIDKSRSQVVIVDAGSTDNSIEVAKASSCCIPVIFVKHFKGIGRGACLNVGAERATGDILLFLRTDCLVPHGYDKVLRRRFHRDPLSLTAFSFGVDHENFKCRIPAGLWIWERYVNFRSHYCKLPSGSQGISVSKTTFSKRKFSDSLIMEDLDFVLSFRNDPDLVRRINTLEEKASVSSIRFEMLGVLKSAFLDCLAQVLFTVFNLRVEMIYNICFVGLPKLLEWFKL
jgi:glycosyltransferase involved in cell wall biosynthesis